MRALLTYIAIDRQFFWQDDLVTAANSARARVRVELTREIKAAARRHLAERGASDLSLRIFEYGKSVDSTAPTWDLTIGLVSAEQVPGPQCCPATPWRKKSLSKSGIESRIFIRKKPNQSHRYGNWHVLPVIYRAGRGGIPREDGSILVLDSD